MHVPNSYHLFTAVNLAKATPELHPRGPCTPVGMARIVQNIPYGKRWAKKSMGKPV